MNHLWSEHRSDIQVWKGSVWHCRLRVLYPRPLLPLPAGPPPMSAPSLEVHVAVGTLASPVPPVLGWVGCRCSQGTLETESLPSFGTSNHTHPLLWDHVVCWGLGSATAPCQWEVSPGGQWGGTGMDRGGVPEACPLLDAQEDEPGNSLCLSAAWTGGLCCSQTRESLRAESCREYAHCSYYSWGPRRSRGGQLSHCWL